MASRLVGAEQRGFVSVVATSDDLEKQVKAARRTSCLLGAGTQAAAAERMRHGNAGRDRIDGSRQASCGTVRKTLANAEESKRTLY